MFAPSLVCKSSYIIGLDSLLHTMLSKQLPVITPWPEDVCRVCTRTRSAPTGSDSGTLCPGPSVHRATPVGSTHITHVDLGHCWASELITHGL